ncbi:MAG: DUF5103 domain-containing protein [Bacteroidota bacterium]|nr:DUF5103 domain-containing protein [Bacteroidota bacterium]
MKRLFLLSLLLFCLCFINCSKSITINQRFTINQKVNSNNSSDKPNDDYYKKNHIESDEFNVDEKIKTIIIKKNGTAFSDPFIDLSSNDKINLQFDDLSDEKRSFYYTINLCNYDWSESELSQNEYLEGFYDNQIVNYQLSFNTIQNYKHYDLVFPNDNIKIIKSGNYVIKVYSDFDKSKIIFTRRFIVYENLLNIEGRVIRSTNIDEKNTKHELEFQIKTSENIINNPYQNLKINARQNRRWDNEIKNIKPKFINGNEFIYKMQDIIFDAGNEFRYFDIRNIRMLSERVNYKEYDENNKLNFYLKEDEKRNFKVYFEYSDINGKMLVTNEYNSNNETESDYIWVYFSLKYPHPIADGSIYILGDLTNWQYDQNSRMDYNFNKNIYEKKMYLKQGYYNYEYIFLSNGSKIGDVSYNEGNHYETENDYYIFAYYYDVNKMYDRIVGLKILNSRR